MANAYIPPGISVSELVSPSFNPIIGDDTTLCIVGPSAGFQSYTETVLLDDKVPYTLAAAFADISTLSVSSASDSTASPYTASSTAAGADGDYVIDESQRSTDGTVTIKRAMQTAITDDETVVVYFENTASPDQSLSFTQEVTLSDVGAASLTNLATTTETNTLKVQKRGIVSSSDYVIANPSTATVTITRDSGASTLSRFEKIWVDYDVVSNETGTITLLGGPTSGTFDLTWNGQTVSGIAHAPSAATVQSDLEGLNNIGAGNISVARTGSGTAGDPYVYTYKFIGSLAGANQTQIQSLTNSLAGGTSPSVNIATSIEGGVTTSYTSQALQLNYNLGGSVDSVATLVGGGSATSTLAWSKNHVIRNTPNLNDSTVAFAYSAGTTEDLDYMVVTSNSDVTTTTVRRSKGTTTIGTDVGRGQVKITYKATPNEYWIPTRVFSQSDVEDKYGAAFASDGSINSPVSFGTYLAFEAGSSGVVVQALFSTDGSGNKDLPTGAKQDWLDTYEVLRDYEDINVVIPLVSTGDLTANDNTSASAFDALRQHIQYMIGVNQYIFGIVGEDATTGGYADPVVLQSHATALGVSSQGTAMQMITPGSFQYPNPVTGQVMNIGGQYAACIFAGRMSDRGIGQTMTRQTLPSIRAVNVLRSESNKNLDAAAGLTVIEAKKGVIRVRHSVTTATARGGASVTDREASINRAKFKVIESVQQTLDQQVLGNLNSDSNAAFTVQVLVSNVLEELIQGGVIAGYDPAAVQVRRVATDPSNLDVRFTYQPLFAINNISISFSLDLTSGDVTAAADTGA